MFSRRNAAQQNRGRAGGSASSWSPKAISGMDLMLEADRGITLNGSNVSAWADQSGAGNHFAEASVQPAYQATGGPSSKPAVYFTAGTRMTGPQFSGAAGQILIVAKRDADPGAGLGGIARFGSAVASEHFPFSDNLHYATFGTTTRISTSVDPGNLAAWFLVDWVSTATEWTARLNRAQYYTTASNTVGWHTSSEIGKDTFGAAGARWEGHISAIYKWSRKLTAAEQARVEAYVLAKWGV
jgi:hypothetical protein